MHHLTLSSCHFKLSFIDLRQNIYHEGPAYKRKVMFYCLSERFDLETFIFGMVVHFDHI